MIRLAIIADDLSGALDAAAPFAARGLSTLVALVPSAIGACLERAPDVIAVSADSRDMTPEAAAAAVRDCLARLPVGVAIFKKIDSRLKGNIAAELDAIPYRTALVVPAIPAFDRWTRDGHLGGFGVSEPINIGQRLGDHADRAMIPDVQDQHHIEAALANVAHDLPVGARGLAEALAKRLSDNAPVRESIRKHDVITYVMGSTDPITKAQIAALRAAVPEINYIAAPDGVADGATRPLAAVNLIEATASGRIVDAATVARGLAETLMALGLQAGQALVISGGATAQMVLGHLGIDTLVLDGEVLAGVPLARAGQFTVITKSGGFGAPDTLVRLLNGSRTQQESAHSDVG